MFERTYYRAKFPREGLLLFYFYYYFFLCGGGVGRGEGGGQGLIIGTLRHVISNEKSFRLFGIRVKTPAARFSKFPKSFRAREAITKIS